MLVVLVGVFSVVGEELIFFVVEGEFCGLLDIGLGGVDGEATLLASGFLGRQGFFSPRFTSFVVCKSDKSRGWISCSEAKAKNKFSVVTSLALWSTPNSKILLLSPLLQFYFPRTFLGPI